MRVGEGRDVAGTDDSVRERVELSGFSVARLGRVKVTEKSVLLVELGEDTGEVTTLLSGDLGSRGVVGGYRGTPGSESAEGEISKMHDCQRTSAVTEGEDAVGTEKAKVLVNEETASRVLLSRDLVHQVLGDLTSSVTGSPRRAQIA